MPDLESPTKRGRKTAQADTAASPPQEERIVSIPLTELHDFPSHPLKVRDDDAMREGVKSIKQYGILVGAIVRPREDGDYEMVAGHRRKNGCELAELTALSCIVREMDNDPATILMGDLKCQK